MSVYGVSGSGTYAVSLTGLDEMMGVLPDNDVNQIRASDVRNVVLTLWENGGGGAGSFSYTHDPVTEASTIAVGGIAVGTTFSNVPLQSLLDNMFYPAVGGIYTISTSPSTLELGNPNRKTTVSVSITKKTPSINSINVSGGPSNTFVPPDKPTSYNEKIDKNYPNTNVTEDEATPYTLTVEDSTGIKTSTAGVTWFYPRWYGSIDLNTLISPSLDTKTLTPSQKTTIIDTLQGASETWSPVWNGSSLTSFQAGSSQLSSATVTPKNTSLGSHIVLIWPSTDYGDGDPSGYTFGGFFGRPFIDLGIHPVQNQHGVIRSCRIWIKDFKSAGTESFTINN
jgi:hypothetical protein